MDADLARMRREYGNEPVPIAPESDPMPLFARWFEEVRQSGAEEPNAMVLSTVGERGPSSRTVLLKGVDDRGFSFFTNYESRKGQELAREPRCSLLFGWYGLHRQVRIEGVATPLPRDEVEEYFAQRPRGAQLGAWASPQSRVVEGRGELDDAFAAAEARFGAGDIPAPPHWGGYVVVPDRIEFWQGRENRLHDRWVYERMGEDWRQHVLAP